MSVTTQTAPARTRWPDGFFSVSDGTRLHYVEAGSGVPVVLIHGARGSAIGNWFSNGIASALARTNHVYALDMRGHGLSGGQRHTPFSMVDDVLEFMDQMGIARAHIGGYSMGGGITLQLLARAPERFITAAFQGSGIREVGAWKSKVPPDLTGEAPDEAAALAQVKARRAGRGEEVGNDLGDKIRKGLALVGGGGAVARMEGMAEHMQAVLSNIDLPSLDIPILAINGEFDRPNARTHRLAREAKAFTNIVLPGKGHLSAMMAGFIPQAYIDGYAAFIVANNPS